MEKLICNECGKIFEYKKLSSCRAQLKQHLKKEHNMELVDYIVKHEYHGTHPLCPCGCGNKLRLKGSGDKWSFNMYHSDTCYGRLVASGNEKILNELREKKPKFDIVKHYESHYDRKTYEDAFKMLKSKQFSLTDVAKSYCIDKRTLKKVWLSMNITNSEELTNLLEYTKYQLSTINNNNNFLNDDTMLSWMYKMIKIHPGKYTIHNLIEKYNQTHPENPCRDSDNRLVSALIKTYGEEVDILLATGYHSSEEYTYYTVMKFFMPEHKIKIGKRFIIDGNYVYYDFFIDSKLLIEYDSTGKFHQEDVNKQDVKKENFAKENGYEFLRLTKNDISKIDTILKIKKILENEIS